MRIKILFTAAVILIVGCVAAGGQEENKAPSVTLTASVEKIAMPLQFNRACIAEFFRRNPKVGRMDAPVTLQAHAVNMGAESLQYSYSVTGGRIEGKGPAVTWNLAGLQPGTYSAAVEAKNGSGATSLNTITVTVSTFHCEWEWFSFKAEISCALDSITVGELATVSVKVERAPPDAEIGFDWTVSAGRIKSGQGTPKITVDTAGVEGPITARVKLRGVPAEFQGDFMCTLFVAAPAPRANKVDEFSAGANCGDIQARLDNFFVSLQNDPVATGYVVLYGEEGKTIRNFVRELQVKNHMELRAFPLDRINILQGEMRTNATTEFWLAPAGANQPQIGQAQWSYDLSKESKPFILGVQALDGIPGCDGYSFPLYAEFLKANPTMSGRVVINEVSAQKFRKVKQKTLDELVRKAGVARKQLKITFVRVRPNALRETTELWLVPSPRGKRWETPQSSIVGRQLTSHPHCNRSEIHRRSRV